MTPDIVLETERLRLRRFTDCDADAALLFDLDSDPEVMRFIGPYLLPNVEAHRQKIRDRFLPQYTHPGRGCLAAEEKTTCTFLGWFFVRPSPEYFFAEQAEWTRPSDLELGYRLRRLAWGKGFAREGAKALIDLAFADPDVTAIVAAALLPNVGSWRVMENCGMTRVRTVSIPGFAEPLVIYSRKRSA
jgi:RimJ/RimL family protein N-acetyltransferase